ncbi:MAG: DUF2490 domain-containing protein [Bacteroidetes bacterium]|nr:DUF2490 domain-containing protein [Bacteroidota bacterium]
MKRLYIFISIIIITSSIANAQRLKDQNTIGWYNVFGTVYVTPRASVWLEYQWRRDDVVKHWQQSLSRIGLQYNFKNGVSALLGYGFILTYPYGDYPSGPHHVPEHRIFEQLVWNGNIGRIGLNHRLRLEQRHLGKVDQSAAEHTITGWNYMNRLRYQLRATICLNKKAMEDNTIYTAAFDEIFIGFGKNVNQNVYDQNRLGLVAGYQFNKSVRFEIGCLNQIVQQAALVTGRQVYQYNTGVITNLYLTKN